MAQAKKKAFPLRLDPHVFEAVQRAATGELRSVNAEIECLLREALAVRGVNVRPPVRIRRGRPPADS